VSFVPIVIGIGWVDVFTRKDYRDVVIENILLACPELQTQDSSSFQFNFKLRIAGEEILRSLQSCAKKNQVKE
jgi:hypothetical protein